jgi:hypothetical protein
VIKKEKKTNMGSKKKNRQTSDQNIKKDKPVIEKKIK